MSEDRKVGLLIIGAWSLILLGCTLVGGWQGFGFVLALIGIFWIVILTLEWFSRHGR